MKTVGESLFTYAIHTAAVQRDLPGLVSSPITYLATDPADRAEVLLDLFSAIDASARDADARAIAIAGGFATSWTHTPREGEPYAAHVRIK